MSRDSEILASDLLTAIGHALYGAQFHRAMSAALDVNPRQLRRWLDGEYTPPAGVCADLAAICAERREALATLAKAASEVAKGG